MISSRVRSTNLAAAAHRARFLELNALPLAPRLGSVRAEGTYWGHIGQQQDWRKYAHTHSFYEICYACAGGGTFEMLGKVYSIRRGDVFIAKPGEPHEIIPARRDTMGIHFWAFTLLKDRAQTRGAK